MSDQDSLFADTIEILVDRIEKIEERLAKLEGKTKKQTGKSDGAILFDYYETAIQNKYGALPARNATVYSLTKMIVNKVGKEDSLKLIDYYMQQKDYQYISSLHSLRLLVRDCDTLFLRMKSGYKVTPAQAKMISDTDSNAEALKQYVAKKYEKQ